MSIQSLVIDIGGTTIRAALYLHNSRSLSGIHRAETPSQYICEGDPISRSKMLIHTLADVTRRTLGEAHVENVVVAFPGPISPEGRILAAPTACGQDKSGLAHLELSIRKMWDAPTLIVNDITAAGFRFLRSKNDDLAIFTISSGLGHKVFLQGKPVLGRAGKGGELGHLRVDYSENAVRCDCGGEGHLGAMASGRGAVAMAIRIAAQAPEEFRNSLLGQSVMRKGLEITPHDIVEGFLSEDSFAGQIISLIARHLGNVIRSVQLSTGVERFVIIGGFGTALGERFRKLVAEQARLAGWSFGEEWDSMIELGPNDDISGLLGAGRIAEMKGIDVY